MSRIIGSARDVDGDPITVSINDNGLIEVESVPTPGLNDETNVYDEMTVAEATALARLLLAAGDVIEG